MTKIQQIVLMIYFIFGMSLNVLSQVLNKSSDDNLIKEKIYKNARNQMLRFNKKQFDSLFFDYFQKSSRPDIILSKNEFYNYTVRIGIYSEKLGLLYKDKKNQALKSKKEWLDKNYQDYLNSKKTK